MLHTRRLAHPFHGDRRALSEIGICEALRIAPDASLPGRAEIADSAKNPSAPPTYNRQWISAVCSHFIVAGHCPKRKVLRNASSSSRVARGRAESGQTEPGRAGPSVSRVTSMRVTGCPMCDYTMLCRCASNSLGLITLMAMLTCDAARVSIAGSIKRTHTHTHVHI